MMVVLGFTLFPGKNCPGTLIYNTARHTKFSMIHQPWLKKLPVDSSKLPQKEEFVVKLSIFQGQFTP